MNEKTGKKVGLWNVIAYGMGDFYGGGSFLLIGMLFMFFLTDVVGLSPAMAAAVFSVGKIWDAVSDPLMGYISDHTKSRLGRRRLYLIIGILPIFLTFIMLWKAVDSSNQWYLFGYYTLSYILFSTVFTMVMVPYSALNAEMTTDFSIRTRMSGFRIVFSQISALLAGTLPKIIIDSYQGDASKGYFIMGAVFGLFYAVPWLIVFFSTWELPYEAPKDERVNILDIFKNFTTIFVNKSFRTHILMYIFAYTAMDVLMALFIYFLNSYLQKPGLYPVAMGSLLITQIIMLSVYIFISNKLGKGFAYRLGLIIWVVGMLSSILLTPDSMVWQLVLVCVLIGAGLSAGVMVPWAILPSVTDVDELITTQKRAGTYSGAMTLVRKMVQGLIAMPLVGFMLQAIKYDSSLQTQTAKTLAGLKSFYIAGPVVVLLLGIAVSFLFKITPARHKIMCEEIDRLKEGGKREDVKPEAKKVCEMLTGISYDKLYIKNR